MTSYAVLNACKAVDCISFISILRLKCILIWPLLNLTPDEVVNVSISKGYHLQGCDEGTVFEYCYQPGLKQSTTFSPHFNLNIPPRM